MIRKKLPRKDEFVSCNIRLAYLTDVLFFCFFPRGGWRGGGGWGGGGGGGKRWG